MSAPPDLRTPRERAQVIFEVLRSLSTERDAVVFNQMRLAHSADADSPYSDENGNRLSYKAKLKQIDDARRSIWEAHGDLHDEVKDIFERHAEGTP